MKRRLLVLWMAMVVGMALLSMCGGSRVGYQGGYDTAYRGQARGGYSAGGGSAGWDTVTLFLACKPDTTHFDGRFTQDRTAAGAAGKLRLGVNTLFRYDVVAQDDTTEAFHTYTTWKNRADSPAAYPPLDPRFGQTGRYAMLTYVNWEDLIPANSQIVSAELKGIVITGGDIASYDNADSVVTVLMEAAGDTAWMKPITGKTIINGLTHHGFANWNWQIWGVDMGASVGRGHPAVSRKKWSPALIDRVHPWQIGEWASFCSTPAVPAADSLVTIDITNCVQGAVNGAVNNGMLTYIQGNTVGSSWRFWINQWQGSGNLAKAPWFKVKYLTKRYASEFPGGARSAFIFSTDDQVMNVNSAYVDTFKHYGGAFTIYTRADQIGQVAGGLSYQQAPYDSLIAWRNRGMEIGSHSRYHWSTWPSGTAFGGGVSLKWYGLNSYRSTWGDIGTYTPRIGLPGCTTGYDSLLYDSEPYWLYDGMGVDEADPYVGKSLATPGNVWRAEVMKAVAHHGYVAARTGQGTAITLADGNRPFGMRAPFRPTATDTIWDGLVAHNQLHPRNMVWQALDYSSQDIVGAKGDTTGAGHLPAIRANTRRAMYYAKNKGTGAVNLFTHAEKSNTNYTLGINTEELGAILRGVNDDDGWIARASEYARHLQDGSRPVDTPLAFAQDDSFKFEAADRVWFKPNGIDGRWIRGLITPQAVINSFDSTAPSAPTLSVATGQNDLSILVWAASPSADVQYYNVYRFFDGAADTTKIGTATSTNYFDYAAINGSPHNYYVTAIDYAGNESAPSSAMTTTPGSILPVGRPAYAGMWYQDRPAAALSVAALDSLQAFDALVTWSYPFKTGAANEVAYDNLLTNLRAGNADQILLTYVMATTPSNDWASYAAGSPEKKIWDYCVAAGADSSGFARNVAGGVIESDAFPVKIINVMYPDIADTLAKFWAAAFDASDSDGEYAGLFVDLADTTLAAHLCDEDGCTGTADFDQDGTAFASDAQEKAAFIAFHVDFLKALRREFAERSMPNRLIVANTGTFGRKPAALMADTDEDFLGLLDGVMFEGFNVYPPGNNADDNKWAIAGSVKDLLVHSQVSPPLVLWHATADSSSQFMSEVLASAYDGFAIAGNTADDPNNQDAIPFMGRRLPAPGTFSGAEIDTVLADASGDTLTATWGNYTGRMILSQAYADTYAVWPYIVYSPTDTLSRSIYWERAGEEGAPPVAQSQILTGDRMLTLAIGAGLGDYVPSDFSHFLIAREYKISSTAYYDTFTVDPDTLDSVYGATGSWWWYNTGLTNGRQYKYKVFSVDVLSNVGTPAPQVTQTPNDNTPPAVPSGLVASGGDGFVDIDWTFPITAADFAHFRLWRALGDGAFALHDSVTISAHQDSTAISGQDYRYYRSCP
jgi:hypothetical protein